MLRRATTQRSGKGAAIALLAGLLAAGAAYGAVRTLSGSGHQPKSLSVGAARPRLPRPRITARPDAQTTSPIATFRLTDGAPRVEFRCSLDASTWRACGRTVTYAAVETGTHRFSARVVRPGAQQSRVAFFIWTVDAPVPPPVIPTGPPFEIAQSGPPPLLYPGAGPSPLPVTLSNPNPDQIQVTSLSVAVTAGPTGCDPRANVSIEPSPVSSADHLVIPAGGTLPVTAAQAPTIELVESGRNQDACRGGSFSLSFNGSAI